jgi:hypothetical protein
MFRYPGVRSDSDMRTLAHLHPRQGTRVPWRLRQSYFRDLIALRLGRIDPEMEFPNP